MQPELETLCRVLEEEQGILSDLLAAQAREREALVRLETVPLVDAVNRIEPVIGRLALVEQARVALTRRLGVDLGIPEDGLDLRAIALRVGEPYRERLLDLRSATQAAAKSLSRANELNEALAVQGIDHVELLLSALLGGVDNPGTYTKSGVGTASATGPRRIIDQVV
ncbi:MAG: flagellar protein FlgN [Planctomycetota bacterium]